jgi:hypothetical protein
MPRPTDVGRFERASASMYEMTASPSARSQLTSRTRPSMLGARGTGSWGHGLSTRGVERWTPTACGYARSAKCWGESDGADPRMEAHR